MWAGDVYPGDIVGNIPEAKAPSQPYSYLLSCLHIGQSFEIDAVEIYCLKCNERRQAVNLVDVRWKVRCTHCLYSRHYSPEFEAVSAARRHVESHSTHAVAINDPHGREIRLIQHTAPTLDEAGF